MRQSTWNRLFGDAAVAEVEANEAAEAEIHKVREFVTRDGYRDFREWLEKHLRDCEVGAGEHATMLAQVGFRQGVQSVVNELDRREILARGRE